ncbi:hypothetical protein [Mucilaginibacter antarcticus]|uniref:Uncharacterized protein n=1 Tax=Mucilaginibacter antarcticus TaxID=1855725 RepID=A0ABW5XKR3_9SPHI
MTDTLRELSDKELTLGQTGVFSYVQTAIPTDDIDYAFADIHNAYLELHNRTLDQVFKTETLKRMVFLNWYYMAEPAMLTGMTDLDHETILASYQLLNDLIKAGELDEEFTWMLAFYSTWGFVIMEFSEPNMPELTAFAEKYRWTVRQPPLKKQLGAVMENRGQMGKFWNALQDLAT